MSEKSSGRSFEFNGLSLDARQRLLFDAAGGVVPLTSRAFDTLLFMVEHPGELLEKERLMDAVWPNAVVEENNLSQSIAAVRRALGEKRNDHRFIVTIPGRGFRFVADVNSVSPDPEPAERPAERETAHAKPDYSWINAAAFGGRPALTIGRDDELTLLRQDLKTAEKGEGRIVLLTGEPGIGKTHMLRTLMTEATDADAAVLCGRCYEEEGSPSYFPWLQIMQAAGQLAGKPELSDLLAVDARALGASVSRGGMPVAGRSDKGAGRQMLFHAALRRLLECTAPRLTVILFDNVHWADAPSLKFLEFAARDLANHRLLIVATYRNVEVTRGHPLFETLGSIGRDAQVRRVRLRGLEKAGVQEIVERVIGRSVSESLVDEIYRQTDGNPFFVNEVARSVAEELSGANGGRIEVRVPDGIREAVGRRLNRLSPACNDILAMAAVIGRVFELPQLERVAGRSSMEILTLLEEAIAAAILDETDQVGRFQFTHALISETLYEELPLSRRVRLHGDVARALEELHADNTEPYLGQIARHHHRAAHAGNIDKAVAAALAAARHAERIVAYEDAAGYFQLALGLLSLDPRDTRSEEARIQLAIADAQANLGISWSEHVDRMDTIISLTRETGDRDCLVEATYRYVFTGLPMPSQKMLDHVDYALSILDPDDLKNQARLLARKAAVLDGLGEQDLAPDVVRRAIALAKQSGDAKVICDTLGWAALVLRSRPETLAERVDLAEQAVEAIPSVMQASVSERETLSAEYISNDARRWLLLNCLEAGATTRLKDLIGDMEQSPDRRPFFRAVLEGGKAQCAFIEGRWSDAKAFLDEAFHYGCMVDDDAANGILGAQMFHLFRELGRLEDVEPLLRRLDRARPHSVWLPGLAILNVEIGRLTEARECFDRALSKGVSGGPREALYVPRLTYLTETCAALGDREKAGELYEALLPYAGQMAVHPTALCLGPADRLLGLLAELLGRPEDARSHFMQALDRSEAAQSPPWLAHTKFELGRLGCHSGDEASSRRVVGEAREIARRVGMAGLLRKIDAWGKLQPVC